MEQRERRKNKTKKKKKGAGQERQEEMSATTIETENIKKREGKSAYGKGTDTAAREM